MRKAWEINRQIGDPLPWLHHVSGRYYTNPLATQMATTASQGDNILWAHPFFVPYTATYDRIGVDLISGAPAASNTSARLGIYNDSTAEPDSLVLDAGTFDMNPNGDKEITISQSLTRGWYWLAFLMDSGAATPLYRGHTGTSNLNWLGSAVALVPATNSGSYLGWSVAQAFGALPDPFTAGGALAGVGSTVAMPAIYLRAA